MKIFFFILISVIIYNNLIAQNNKDERAELKFETNFYNFDTIDFEKPVNCVFKFKNIGKADLFIKNVIVGCGCTVPEWSKMAYKKRKNGFLKVNFNAGKKGLFFKTIMVQTNGKTPNHSLAIKGFVR
jgi:hypothetical protein